jgi:hypothetical protein
MAGDDASHIGVGFGVISVECCDNNGFVYARGTGAAKIRLDVSYGIPGRGHAIAFPCMTMAVDDHACHPFR